MIKDENERMNFQVENVLRMSQLERKENILKKSSEMVEIFLVKDI